MRTSLTSLSAAFVRSVPPRISHKPSLYNSLLALSPIGRITDPPEDIHEQILRDAVDFAAYPNASARSISWDITKLALSNVEKLDAKTLDKIGIFGDEHPDFIPTLLLSSSERGPGIYDAQSTHSALPIQPEQYLFLLAQMLNQDITPSIRFVETAIRVCCDWDLPRLALEIAERVESKSSERVKSSSWAEILIASADNHYIQGVDRAWTRARETQSYTPDAGLILRILETAARWGRPDLVSRAFEGLTELQAPVRDYHLAPAVESYVNAGQVPEAFQMVSSFRALGIEPTMELVEPIVNVLTTREIIDQAFFGLEDMQKTGQAVDVVCINAIILASARLGDLRRARATQSAMDNFGVSPNSDTFNFVLEACIAAKHRPLGDTIISEMGALSVPLKSATYERLIRLCLTSDEYDDAFFYLEECKEKGHTPTAMTYIDILRRCVECSDQRWVLVREELLGLGYQLDPLTKRMLREYKDANLDV